MFLKYPKEYEKRDMNEDKINSHGMRINNYIINIIVPNFVAYFIASSYYSSSEYEDNLDLFIKEALDYFNVKIAIDNKLLEKIKDNLLYNYGLEIINDKPLQVKEV